MSTLTANAHPYAAAAYGDALGHIGRRVSVPEWESFVLARPLPCEHGEDGLGAYPLAVIARGSDVRAGFDRLAAQRLVSVVLVPDPLHAPPRARLADAFDLCRPFKTHYLIDPDKPFEPTSHHRRYMRRGLARCRVSCVVLADYLPHWKRLYGALAQKHEIRGPADFGDAYFEALAQQDSMTAFAAHVGDDVVAMTIWFAHDGVVYHHLTASNEAGYENGAGFGLYAAAIDHFSGQGIINLGGGAGFTDDPNNGLAAFKRGFANASVEALLCGAILDRERYAALSRTKQNTSFFPAYRG